MRYLMFVATDPENVSEPSLEGTLPIEDWCDKYDASGARVTGERVRPAQDATTVRRRGGKLLVTDGPFAESREWIVGFDILDCADLDEAIAVAAEHPMAAQGRLELRPYWPFEEPANG
ncbi:MAG: YciI family protein [Actinomycetota bacterium]|nr:YciI family protein [Actinomycetota bacterium]